MSDSSAFPVREAVETREGVACALEAVYNWNYEPEIDALRTLYANALDRQWIALRDLDWETEVDTSRAIANLDDALGFPFTPLRTWQEVPEEKKRRIGLRANAFLLSQFLHGEQGALMVAAQLVSAVPHMDGKFYASTQTLDEARHVEVFSKYVAKLDHIYEIGPVLRKILDGVLSTDSWTRKAVGMQIVLEGLALASFRNLGRVTEEPLLKDLLRRVTQDEARHTGYGIKYLEHVIPTLSEAERAELEDFAFESARMMMDQSTGGLGQRIFGIFHEEGVDVAGGLKELKERRGEVREHIVAERRKAGFDSDPLRGFVVPTLAKIGLFSERIVPSYRDLIERNMITGFEGTIFDGTFSLPDDLEAWVEETS